MSTDKHARPLMALRALRHLVKGGATYASLGATLGVSRSAVDRLLAALTADGVEITRVPNPEHASHLLLSVSREAALRTLGLDS